jgi:TPP-dependent pyruvate/acetoin dehydrogenase alpha subunit
MSRPECLALPTDISLQAGLFGVLLSSDVAEGMDVPAVEAGVKQAADFLPSGNGPFLLNCGPEDDTHGTK